MSCPECLDPECVDFDQCDYCPECEMMGEHDERCSVVAERLQCRADHLLDSRRDEEALAGEGLECPRTSERAPTSDFDAKGKG